MTTIQQLLAPMAASDFFAHHWGKKPLFLSGRSARFDETAFDVEEMKARLATKPPAVALKAQFFDTAGKHREMPITARQISLCYDAGMTICAGPLEELLPAIGEWASALQRSAGFAGKLTIMNYWSPEGSGFGWHYDEVGVFICQIRGAKRWWFSPAPAVGCPRRPFVYTPQGVDQLRAQGIDLDAPQEDEAQTVLLQPGDMLYLPAGTWHRTKAEGSESVALTVGAVGGGADSLVDKCLGEWMHQDRTWARALPFIEPSQLVRGEIPAVVAEELTERLARLKVYVDTITVDDLVRIWARERA